MFFLLRLLRCNHVLLLFFFQLIFLLRYPVLIKLIESQCINPIRFFPHVFLLYLHLSIPKLLIYFHFKSLRNGVKEPIPRHVLLFVKLFHSLEKTLSRSSHLHRQFIFHHRRDTLFLLRLNHLYLLGIDKTTRNFVEFLTIVGQMEVQDGVRSIFALLLVHHQILELLLLKQPIVLSDQGNTKLSIYRDSLRLDYPEVHFWELCGLYLLELSIFSLNHYRIDHPVFKVVFRLHQKIRLWLILSHIIIII